MFFYLTKILTAIALPPFNIAVIWIFSLILNRLHYKKISRFLTIFGNALSFQHAFYGNDAQQFFD